MNRGTLFKTEVFTSHKLCILLGLSQLSNSREGYYLRALTWRLKNESQGQASLGKVPFAWGWGALPLESFSAHPAYLPPVLEAPRNACPLNMHGFPKYPPRNMSG